MTGNTDDSNNRDTENRTSRVCIDCTKTAANGIRCTGCGAALCYKCAKTRGLHSWWSGFEKTRCPKCNARVNYFDQEDTTGADVSVGPMRTEGASLAEIRDECLKHLRYTERRYASAIPLEVLTAEVERCVTPHGLQRHATAERVEFWKWPEAEKDVSVVYALFLERDGSDLKVNFGRLSATQQALRATNATTAGAGLLLFGPLGAGLGAALGAGIGAMSKAFETAILNNIEALVHRLNPKYKAPPIANTVAGSTTAADGGATVLERLFRLKEAGAISDAEYEKKKQEILARM